MDKQIFYTSKETELLDRFNAQVRCAVKEELTEFRQQSSKSSRANYLTRKQVCDMLHISYPTLHRLINRGILLCMKVGKRSLFDASLVHAILIKRNTDSYGQ